MHYGWLNYYILNLKITGIFFPNVRWRILVDCVFNCSSSLLLMRFPSSGLRAIGHWHLDRALTHNSYSEDLGDEHM